MTVNLKLDIGEVSLDYRNGEPFRTRVVLTNEDGVYYPVFLDAKEIENERSILYDVALNEVYERNFPQRAENEKFNLIGEKIAKYDELIEKSQMAIKDLEQATEEAKLGTIKNEQAVNRAVSELTELVMGVLASISPVEEVDEGTHEELTE